MDDFLLAEPGEYQPTANQSSIDKDISAIIPLPQLTRADEQVKCLEGFFPVSQVSNVTADKGEGRRIPKIIHQTGKTKCLTETFHKNAEVWSFEGHSFYFHDNIAVARLLNKTFPEFPHLQIVFECLKHAGGAAIADLYRYLILWEYGGIYTDMDNVPKSLFNDTTITPEMDAFFLLEPTGILSQYFFAISPRHPLMFLAVYDVLESLLDLEDWGTFYVPALSGPRCLRRAFIRFMNQQRFNARGDLIGGKPSSGTHYGLHNRSITVVGTRETAYQWVRRGGARGGINLKKKIRDMNLMNVSDYQHLNTIPRNQSCQARVLEQHYHKEEVVQEVHRLQL